MNNLRTLIRSNADAFPNPVLSPNSTIPAPGEKMIGFILFE